MQLRFYLLGAVPGFTYSAVVEQLATGMEVVRQRKSQVFTASSDASGGEVVTLEFSIPDMHEVRYRFDISVWDEHPGLSQDEALVAHKVITEVLFYDYSYLHREIGSMACQYRNVSAFLTPLERVPPELVTLVTQCSLDRLPRLKEQALAFGNNPLSVAVYIPSLSQGRGRMTDREDLPGEERDDAILHGLGVLHAELAELGVRRVTMSLLFGNAPSSNDYDNLYPINSLRNVALDAATTELVLLVDVDYVPSPELTLTCSASASSPYEKYRDMCRRGDVLAVLAFEVHDDVRELPGTREELEQLWHKQGRWGSRSLVDIFYFTNLPNRHLPSNFERWFSAEEPFAVEYHGTRIDGYASYAKHTSMFEPYAIASKASVPRYDERFRGYGFDKISHAHEWAAMGARFWVLPHVFFTARKHEPSEVKQLMWIAADRNAEHEKRMLLLWEYFRRQLVAKYSTVFAGGGEQGSQWACVDDPDFDVGNGGCSSYGWGK